MKIVIFVVFCLFSVDSLACFVQPEGLTEKHEFQAKIFFSLAIVFFIFAVVLRLICNRKRIWVPLLFVTSYTYWPAYIWHWGQAYSGSCGNPEIVLAFKILAGGMAILLSYEIFKFFKFRRKNAT